MFQDNVNYLCELMTRNIECYSQIQSVIHGSGSYYIDNYIQ